MKETPRERIKNSNNEWLLTKTIAHRGLWSDNIIENTIPAFKNAIEKGYSIETDVWRIKDGTLIIYHDDSLKRLCGVDKLVKDIENIEELSQYRVAGKEKIPLFDEFLDTVNGKTEILIEIKTYDFDGKTEKAIYERLKSYDGKYAIESFNSYTVLWFKKNAPSIIRGQLSCYFEDTKFKGIKKILQQGMKKLYFNKLTKPDFVAYDKKHFPNKYLSKSQKKGIPIILWTIKNMVEFENVINQVDNVIFDSFICPLFTNHSK